MELSGRQLAAAKLAAGYRCRRFNKSRCWPAARFDASEGAAPATERRTPVRVYVDRRATAASPLQPSARKKTEWVAFHTYCGRDYAAACGLLALKLLGHNDVRLYGGSWAERSADPELPIETSGG